MKRTPKDTTIASQRRAIQRRLDQEDHSGRLREFMVSRGVSVPQRNVAEANPGASIGGSRSMAPISVDNDAIQHHNDPHIEVCLTLLTVIACILTTVSIDKS